MRILIALFLLAAAPAPACAGLSVSGQLDPSELPTSGVTAGTYACPSVTVDQYGRVTSIASQSCGGGGGGRTLLTANQDEYISPTGVDTGGCTNSASPCQTATYAYAQAQKTLDLGGNVITVHCSGSYTLGSTWTFDGALTGGLGAPSFLIQGTVGDDAACAITGPASANAITLDNGAQISIDSVTFSAGAGAFGLVVQDGIAVVSNTVVEAQGVAPFDTAGNTSRIWLTGAMTLNGVSSIAAPFIAEDLSEIWLTSSWTLTNDPTWTNGFVQADWNAMVDETGFSYSGSGTGPRYNVQTGGAVLVNGGGPNFNPGTIAGSIDATTYGVYK